MKKENFSPLAITLSRKAGGTTVMVPCNVRFNMTTMVGIIKKKENFSPLAITLSSKAGGTIVMVPCNDRFNTTIMVMLPRK